MGEHLADGTEDGVPSQESIAAFVAVAPEVTDPRLRDAASTAAEALTSDPATAVDPLAAVYDRCVELDETERDTGAT